MILLLYADNSEVKQMDYKYMWCIGLGAKRLPMFEESIKDFAGVVLFGSCGLLKEYYKGKYDRFIVPDKWISDAGDIIKTDDLLKLTRMGTGLTWPGSVRSKHLTEYVKTTYPEAMCVDQESFIVAKYCQERQIPFISVRYVIDRCNRKVMLPAFNYFWRRNQHKRMQRKFNELIKSA
jgi:hypothetical protein